METVETELHYQEGILDEGTRRRNREFKRRMDAVQERQIAWSERLGKEERERDLEHDHVMKNIEDLFNTTVKGIWDKIEEDFSVFHRVHIPPLEERMKVQEEGEGGREG